MSVSWKQLITTDDIYNYMGADDTMSVTISPPNFQTFFGLYNMTGQNATFIDNCNMASYYPTRDGWGHVITTRKNNTLTHWTPRFTQGMFDSALLNPFRGVNWRIGKVKAVFFVPGQATQSYFKYNFKYMDWYVDFLYFDIGTGKYIEDMDVPIPEPNEDVPQPGCYQYTNDADDLAMNYTLQNAEGLSVDDQTYLDGGGAAKIFVATADHMAISDSWYNNNPEGEGFMVTKEVSNFMNEGSNANITSYNTTTLVIPQIFKRWKNQYVANNSNDNANYRGSCQIKLILTLEKGEA